MANEVVLLDVLPCSFGMRVRIALAEKGIAYEYKEQSIWGNNKSPLLLQMNPIHKMVPYFGSHEGVYDSGKRVLMKKGEVQEEAKKEMIQCLKALEGELGDKPYFGGQNLGFMDIAFIPYHSWFYSYETCGNFNIGDECPKLMEWRRRCLEKESVSKSLYHPHKVYEYVLELQKMFGPD